MAQGLEREPKGQSKSKDVDEKISKLVRCGEGRVMGSRRIFPPQFKLQVLDSYRKDEDCKGNQRATARKYGIHRRQIQKWLQAEASLRTSVEVVSEGRQQPPQSPPQPQSQPQPQPQPQPPAALNLTSAGEARQRDDSGSACVGGGGAGGSLAAKVSLSVAVAHAPEEPRPWPAEPKDPDVAPRPHGADVHRAVYLGVLKDDTEEEDDEEEDYDDEDDDSEEGVSEEDNMEGRGAYNNDEALDFSCAALGKRRSFSLQFKLEVLDAFRADGLCHGNQRATARKFGINRRQVQKWLGQEEELRGEAAFRGGLYRQRLGRWLEAEEGVRKGGGAPAAAPEPDHLAAAAAMSAAAAAAAMFGRYAASASAGYCWDLSKKRKARDADPDEAADEDADAAPTKSKKAREGEECRVAPRDVSSTCADVPAAYAPAPPPPPPALAPAPDAEQETALCLVKARGDAEVTSSLDTHPFLHEPFLARHPPFHLGPLALPAAYDFYSFHCRHPCLQHLQTPKWFHSRAAAVPGFF